MDNEYYEKDGRKYDRITRILDYFQSSDLVDWKIKVGKKEAKRISTEAMNIGTNIDEAIKADIQGLKAVKLKTQEAKNCWEAYKQWKMDYDLNLFVGETLFQEEYLVAGTPDLYTHDTIIDIKCSNEIRDNYWIQTSVYAWLKKDCALNVAILRLDKNLGCYEYKKLPASEYALQAFLGLLTAYRFYNKTEYARQKEEV